MTALPPFSTVVDEYGTTVLRYCRALATWHDAEDAWSETFLSALKAYPELPHNANIEAWLITIARRKVIDQARTRGRLPIPIAEVPEQQPPQPQDRDGLYEELGTLPDKQRLAVVYRHLGGLEYAEIAAILGNSQAAARRAVADGLNTLRKTYQGNYHDRF
ncbi:MAG: RNA polymerase sigma factor [Antricoccus sp.]